MRDHPRARGEQRDILAKINCDSGSSPRARGADYDFVLDFAPLGIIPARAGSRLGLCQLPAEGWDHPRARGEQITLLQAALLGAGSSPRARGAALYLHQRIRCERIIPARAGSRVLARHRYAGVRDHPRARGAADTLGGPQLAHGIIPARAGSSVRQDSKDARLRDHPRARGEQVPHAEIHDVQSGIIPARGEQSLA
mgnify:CR=1 FL=1